MLKRQVPFDSFALPIKGFNLHGNIMSKSWVGFVFTLGLFGAVTAILISELVSMFARESLTVSIAEEGVSTPAATSLKSVMMAFGVMKRSSPLVSLTHDVDFNIKASLVTVTFFGSDPRQLSSTKQNITIETCTDAYFGDMLASVEKSINVDDIYCIPQDTSEDLLTIEGKVGSDTYKYIEVAINCGAVGATSCPSTFVSSNIFFMYGATYLDETDYSDPIKMTATAIQDRADMVSYHEKSIYITPREIVTDQGLAFSSLTSETDLVVSEGASIVEGINVLTPNVFTFQIKMGPTQITVKRTYKTILDVLASVTGIASTITLVVGVLLKPYVEELTHNHIMKSFSPSKYKDKEITIADHVKALFGNKTAKDKLEKRRKDKEWIVKNMDLIEMLKNWKDLQMIKKLVMVKPLKSLEDVKNSDSESSKRPSLVVGTQDIELGIPPQEQM